MDANAIWQLASSLLDTPFWAGLIVGIALVYMSVQKKERRGASWLAFSLIPALIITFLVSESMKYAFEVARPCSSMPACPATYSFPSNHASVIFAFAVVMWINSKGWKARAAVAAIAVLVCISRVVLGVHTPFDVIGGALIGVVSGAVVNSLYNRLYHH